MRTPKSIPVGSLIEWEVTLCRNRGTYKDKKIIVKQISGMNLLDEDNDYYYWTEIKYKENVRCTPPPPPVVAKKNGEQ